MHELRPATHKICFLDAKLFLRIKKRPVFDQVLLVFQRKKMRRTQRCVLQFKSMIYSIIHNNTSGYFIKWKPDNLQIAESTFLG